MHDLQEKNHRSAHQRCTRAWEVDKWLSVDKGPKSKLTRPGLARESESAILVTTPRVVLRGALAVQPATSGVIAGFRT